MKKTWKGCSDLNYLELLGTTSCGGLLDKLTCELVQTGFKWELVLVAVSVGIDSMNGKLFTVIVGSGKMYYVVNIFY